MNKDLLETLNELGPEYHRLVREMKGPFEAEVPARHFPKWKVAYLAAAVVVIVLGLAVVFSPRTTPSAAPHIYTIAYAATSDALEAIVAAQKADGSWENDFLTQQNAAALESATDPTQRIAYLRAVRYLRKKGLAPLTPSELAARREALESVN